MCFGKETLLDYLPTKTPAEIAAEDERRELHLMFRQKIAQAFGEKRLSDFIESVLGKDHDYNPASLGEQLDLNFPEEMKAHAEERQLIIFEIEDMVFERMAGRFAKGLR